MLYIDELSNYKGNEKKSLCFSNANLHLNPTLVSPFSDVKFKFSTLGVNEKVKWNIVDIWNLDNLRNDPIILLVLKDKQTSMLLFYLNLTLKKRDKFL